MTRPAFSETDQELIQELRPPKSAIEKLGKDFYAFWASPGIAQGILPPLFRETGIYEAVRKLNFLRNFLIFTNKIF
jgi:hypothetical protein